MQTFDFIVVGAGSGGTVVAERLSANGRYSLLVLEDADSDRRFLSDGAGRQEYSPRSELELSPERPGASRHGEPAARKILGGSRSIKSIMDTRPSPIDPAGAESPVGVCRSTARIKRSRQRGGATICAVLEDRSTSPTV